MIKFVLGTQILNAKIPDFIKRKGSRFVEFRTQYRRIYHSLHGRAVDLYGLPEHRDRKRL